ncbi:putative rrna processing protein [Neofusicoccum parvum UCRNP2]|uniref:Putative rrna processing protein n=1 Tax=Botryosphaeria parva (strain UCR-NP2) TaxID=1287680 RepID=R1GFK7_BOTPV|nr:putative rrna processing protein [Neofusicoccum parvum UCRNP2]
MVKKGGSKLLNLLQKEKGFDYKKDKQKRLAKQAEKRKQQKEEEDSSSDEEGDVEGGVTVNGEAQEDSSSGGDEAEKQIRSDIRKAAAKDGESEDDEDSEEEESSKIDLSRLEEDDSDSSGEELEDAEDDDDDDEEEEDVPLSDLDSVASDEKGDIVPHQRLTINNTSALLAAVHRIEWKTKKLPFSDHQAVTSDEAIEIADTNDDLGRELAFYQQALSAVKTARGALKKEGVPFSRPTDYFAEMVKSDEHMGKIKQKLIDEAAGKKAAAEARRQRDLKKFGKAVQVAKEQEKAKSKRETMEKINLLKRKRQGADLEKEKEDDLFDVALEDTAETERKEKLARKQGRGGAPNPKRAKKDAKYGFGGKKRFAKSNDANSSADMKGFSVKKMKAGGAKQRPGKARRNARK